MRAGEVKGTHFGFSSVFCTNWSKAHRDVGMRGMMTTSFGVAAMGLMGHMGLMCLAIRIAALRRLLLAPRF
jgi:hypothetical protein